MTNKGNNQKLYWPPAVTVDVVIFTIENDQLKVLVIKRKKPPFEGSWALPGGFLARDESAKEGATRVLKEKTGIGRVYVEQLYTFDSPHRDPRGHVISIAYFALVPRAKMIFGSGKKLQTPSLVPIKQLTKLAFDHKSILKYALQRLRYKLEYTNVAFSLLPKNFPFSQLQRAYEIIWDKKLDKRNFRKKFLALGLIKPTKQKLAGSQHRPAQLHTFINKKPISLRRFF